MFCFLALSSLVFAVGAAQQITYPQSISSSNGDILVNLKLEETTHSIANSDISFTTRLYNSQFPGPTIRLKAGDTFRVDFTNDLTDQGLAYEHNRFSAPDETNLHFHGLHVSGELPSDDTTFVVLPGQSYSYSTQLPDDHLPGTHWLHPHRHGSSALQVGGGAALAIIVEDEPGSLPDQVENATEVLFFAQQMDLVELQSVASRSRDSLLSVSVGTSATEFVAVNGQVNPVISVVAGEWVRFRVVWAAWLQGELDFAVEGCEMQLLAKDGVYIRDFPRAISVAPIVPAGRADIMVRCMAASTTYNINGAAGVMARIQTTADAAIQSSVLQAWSPVFPSYLADLQNEEISAGCSCATELDDNAVNGVEFHDAAVLHTTYLGAIAERALEANNHPYHQHVYPFQLTASLSNYYAAGDWHDTIQGDEVVVRFQPTVFVGTMMIHCHRLDHEDQGMMAMEEVSNITGSCTCGDVEGLEPAVVAAVVAGCVILLAGLAVFWNSRRRAATTVKDIESS